MMRTSQWLAVLGTACVAACYTSGVVAVSPPPADSSPAQLPAETSRAASPSGLTLTCEMFCSQTKARTGNARLRWTMAAADRAQSRVLSLATAKQTLEFSVYGPEFEKELVATLPVARRAGVPAIAQGKPPARRAYQVRLLQIEKPADRAVDAAGEMTVVIEDVEPGMNYSWRVVIEAPDGRLVSVPVTCQAPTCPADFIRRQP